MVTKPSMLQNRHGGRRCGHGAGGSGRLASRFITVTGSGTTADPWQISLSPKDGGSTNYQRISLALIATVADPERGLLRASSRSIVCKNWWPGAVR